MNKMNKMKLNVFNVANCSGLIWISNVKRADMNLFLKNKVEITKHSFHLQGVGGCFFLH